MTTRVYIDGFNLYYGLIRENRLHWLDLQQFSERLNLGQKVDKILYCTAMVSSTPDDPDKAHRQFAYHQALRIACPAVEIILGAFTTHRKFQPVSGCKNSPTCAVTVMDRNEKGSDVNLATRLVHDAHSARFDRAIVVSGDSDLVEPVRIVVSEIGKPVWVRNPRPRDSKELISVASNYSRIVAAVLKNSQLPEPVTDGVKIIKKPPIWSQPRQLLNRCDILSAKCPQAGCLNSITTCRYQ